LAGHAGRSVSPRAGFGVVALKALQHKAFSPATRVAWCVNDFLGCGARPQTGPVSAEMRFRVAVEARAGRGHFA